MLLQEGFEERDAGVQLVGIHELLHQEGDELRLSNRTSLMQRFQILQFGVVRLRWRRGSGCTAASEQDSRNQRNGSDRERASIWS